MKATVRWRHCLAACWNSGREEIGNWMLRFEKMEGEAVDTNLRHALSARRKLRSEDLGRKAKIRRMW